MKKNIAKKNKDIASLRAELDKATRHCEMLKSVNQVYLANFKLPWNYSFEDIKIQSYRGKSFRSAISELKKSIVRYFSRTDDFDRIVDKIRDRLDDFVDVHYFEVAIF